MARNESKEVKYNTILNAAVKVFAQHGFFNSRVTQIAKEAKVADGTIYLYFKNKDDLLISLFEKKMNEIIEKINVNMTESDDIIEKIRIYIRSYFQLVKENKELAEVITLELRQSTKFMKEYDNKKFIEYLNLVSKLMHEGVESGILKPDLMPGMAKRMLFGMMQELTLNWVLRKNSSSADLDKLADYVIDLFIDGIIIKDPLDGGK